MSVYRALLLHTQATRTITSESNHCQWRWQPEHGSHWHCQPEFAEENVNGWTPVEPPRSPLRRVCESWHPALARADRASVTQAAPLALALCEMW